MPAAKKNNVVKLSGGFHDPELEENGNEDGYDQDEPTPANDLLGGFTCDFIEHDDGTVTFRLWGDAELIIRTAPIESFKKVPEKADGLAELYVSPVVRNPQVDLRSVMEWSGRQLAVHAVTEAWNAIYPPERGTGRHSLKVKLEAVQAENAVIAEENAKKDAMIEEMLTRLGFGSMEEFRAAQ